MTASGFYSPNLPAVEAWANRQMDRPETVMLSCPTFEWYATAGGDRFGRLLRRLTVRPTGRGWQGLVVEEGEPCPE